MEITKDKITEIFFFVVGREPEKVTFRFAKRNASFNFSGTFRFADYSLFLSINNKRLKKVLPINTL